MNDTQTELRKLGERLWPDDSMLAPSRMRGKQPAPRRSAALSVVVGVGTAAVVVIVVVGGLMLARSRTTAPPAATPPAATPAVDGGGPVAQMKMLSTSDGWGWNAAHFVGRTLDGARSFVDVTPPGISSQQYVTSVAATDMQHAWVLVGRSDVLPNLVYRTIDGGVTWVVLSIGTRDLYIEGMAFIDSRYGWAEAATDESRNLAGGGYFELLRTVDGGDSWSDIGQPPPLPAYNQTTPLSGCTQFQLPVFVTPLLGAQGLQCGSTPLLQLTTNGGVTWRPLELPRPAESGSAIMFSDTEVPMFTSPEDGSVFASVCVGRSNGGCMTSGAFYRTIDGGATWHATTRVLVGGLGPDIGVATLTGAFAWSAGACVTPCHALAATPYSLLVTYDLGQTWNREPVPSDLGPSTFESSTSFEFVNSRLGFAFTWRGLGIPGPNADSGTSMYRTQDGGHSWTKFVPLIVHP